MVWVLPQAIDVIFATNPRYAGAAVIDEDARGLCDPFPNVGMRNVTTDAKLNAAKAIVAERSFNAIDGLDGEFVRLILTGATADQLREFREKLSAALTAWREL